MEKGKDIKKSSLKTCNRGRQIFEFSIRCCIIPQSRCFQFSRMVPWQNGILENGTLGYKSLVKKIKSIEVVSRNLRQCPLHIQRLSIPYCIYSHSTCLFWKKRFVANCTLGYRMLRFNLRKLQLKVYRFSRVTLHDYLIYSQNFRQKSTERMPLKKYCNSIKHGSQTYHELRI